MARGLVVALALLVVSCGGGASGPEQQVLSNFFRAARVRDNVTIGNLSAVSFDARTEGTVQDFTIAKIGEEQRRALPIRDLTAAVDKAKADDEEFAKRKRVYQDANMPALQRVVKAEQAKQTVQGGDAAIQAAWTKWRQDQNESSRRVSDARAKLASEERQAIASLTAPGRDDVDISKMDVEVVSKVVTVSAQVRTPDGQTVPKTLAVTLQRAIGKQGAQTIDGRWLITAIQQQGGAPTT
jgi:hypothetical protein